MEKIMPQKFVNKKFAKDSEYGNVIEEISHTKKCPFCRENFKYHKNPILKEEGGWLITENSWPYENTRYHFLLIGETHKESFAELTDADFVAIKTLINWAIQTYNIPGGGIAMRFGDTDHTGSTVCHLHFHLIVPRESADPEKTVDPVWFPFG